MKKPTGGSALAKLLAGGELEKRVRAWNNQADDVRIRRAGVRAGVPFSGAAVRRHLPFTLPKRAVVYEDGTIDLRPARGHRGSLKKP